MQIKTEKAPTRSAFSIRESVNWRISESVGIVSAIYGNNIYLTVVEQLYQDHLLQHKLDLIIALPEPSF